MARLSVPSNPQIYALLVLLFQVLRYVSAQSSSAFVFSAAQQKNFAKESFQCEGEAELTTEKMVSLSLTSSGVNEAVKGRCLYKNPVFFDSSAAFSTMFSFGIIVYPTFEQGDGFVFFIAPDSKTWEGDTGEYLGWVNQNTNTSGVNFAVEFDILKNKDIGDIDNNHVGINVNSPRSLVAQSARTAGLTLTTSSTEKQMYAWVDYDGSVLQVRLSKEETKPCTPLIDFPFALARVVVPNNPMYVGFAGSTSMGKSSQIYVYDWSFSTSGKITNIYKPDAQCKREIQWALILGSICGCVSIMVFVLVLVACLVHETKKVSELKEALLELEHLDCGPRKFTFREIKKATKRFSKPIGEGGFGVVYKGTLYGKEGPKDVAVKKIQKKRSDPDVETFISEVKIVGVLKHKNLVRVLGWCYEEVGEMYLVYEYMPNNNLQRLLAGPDFSWEKRLKSLKEVAAALLYLHEECDGQIAHYDVKSNNVMLDKHFNACLGDFGTSRLYFQNGTNLIPGFTLGYVSPEYFKTGTGSPKSDVHSFGIVILEIVTGRDPQKHEGGLQKWVWELYHQGKLEETIDPKLKNIAAEKELGEMIKALKLGLVCCVHTDPDSRPTMRQVFYGLQGNSSLTPSFEIPPLNSNNIPGDMQTLYHGDAPDSLYYTAQNGNYTPAYTEYYNAYDFLPVDLK